MWRKKTLFSRRPKQTFLNGRLKIASFGHLFVKQLLFLKLELKREDKANKHMVLVELYLIHPILLLELDSNLNPILVGEFYITTSEKEPFSIDQG